MLFLSLFFFFSIFANDNDSLRVVHDGFIVEVVDFEEGDKLKLFEVQSGDHVLSKSYKSIDLSQLPIGSYLLENNKGQSVIIDRLEEELVINGSTAVNNDTFILGAESVKVEDVSEDITVPQEITTEEKPINDHLNSQQNLLSIQREGDVVTVVNFEEGDKLRLFEVKGLVHVLSKTTNVIDLSQLPVGAYVLEDNRGNSVIVKK